MNSETVREHLARGRLKKLDAADADIGLLLLDALADGDWRVRRNALRVLDHAPVDGMESRIIDLLQDEEEEVRKWAAHSLGCDRCKNGSTLAVDPVPYLIAAAEMDESIAVRRSAVVCLAWNRPWNSRIEKFMGRLSVESPDQKIRFHAESSIAHHSKCIA